MIVNTAPTRLTPMQYARLQQWREELCAIARKALENPDHPGDPETLARWAADTLGVDGLFWTADEKRIKPILRSAYEFAGRTITPSHDTQEERYELIAYDMETSAHREARVAGRKLLEPDRWDALDDLVDQEND